MTSFPPFLTPEPTPPLTFRYAPLLVANYTWGNPFQTTSNTDLQIIPPEHPAYPPGLKACIAFKTAPTLTEIGDLSPGLFHSQGSRKMVDS